MSQLKTNHLKKCFSILREFVNETTTHGSEKDRVILALDQLQKITAGTYVSGDDGQTVLGPNCIGRPRADR